MAMLAIIVHRFLAVLVLLITCASAQEPAPQLPATPVVTGSHRYQLQTLPYTTEKPVALVSVPDDGARLLVVELGGLVRSFTDGEQDAAPILNLVGRVTALHGEQGMFSIAVEPRSAAESHGRGRFVYAAYTEKGSGDLIVGRYPLDEATGSADREQELVMLRVSVPEPFHHGGHLEFGPDGMLYVGIGDGESSNHFLHEPPWSAPSLDTLRGKLLRLDVSGGWDEAHGYRVPPDNPYVAVAGALPEIYASGFRNPWKFHFDPGTGDLYLADVGNDRYEEINLVVSGADHGWPSLEGFECQRLPDAPGLVDPQCDPTRFAAPLVAYGHLALDPAGGQAVTGGAVSYDPALPDLVGAYLYGDFVTGRIWALPRGSATPIPLVQATPGLTDIANGPHGEVLVAYISGPVARIVPASSSP